MSQTQKNVPAGDRWRGGFSVSRSPIDDRERLAFVYLNTAKRIAQERTDAGFPSSFRFCTLDSSWEVIQDDVPEQPPVTANRIGMMRRYKNG